MTIRTYTRTLFNDIFTKNIFVLLFNKIVNFCCNHVAKNPNTIKFNQNVPTTEHEKKNVLFFQSVTGDKIDCK